MRTLLFWILIVSVTAPLNPSSISSKRDVAADLSVAWKLEEYGMYSFGFYSDDKGSPLSDSTVRLSPVAGSDPSALRGSGVVYVGWTVVSSEDRGIELVLSSSGDMKGDDGRGTGWNASWKADDAIPGAVVEAGSLSSPYTGVRIVTVNTGNVPGFQSSAYIPLQIMTEDITAPGRCTGTVILTIGVK